VAYKLILSYLFISFDLFAFVILRIYLLRFFMLRIDLSTGRLEVRSSQGFPVKDEFTAKWQW